MRRFGDDESKVPYFEAGLKLLAEHGEPGLMVTSVCADLDVTTGGFYYYFKNLRHYVEELLAYWLEASTTAMVEHAFAETDLRTRLRVLISESARLPHRAEAAIRHWAFNEPAVAAVLATADAARTDVLRSTLAELGLEKEFSQRISDVALYLLIGHESQDPERQDPETFRWGLELLLQFIEREAGLESRHTV